MSNSPHFEHIELFRKMHGLVAYLPDVTRIRAILYADTLTASEALPTVPIDLPSIGADGLNPDLLRYLDPKPTNTESRTWHSGYWFRFLAFRNGEPWVAESDRGFRRACNYAEGAPHDYVLVSSPEGPPYIINYGGMINGDEAQVPRHYISPEEARAFGDAILNLTPLDI